jgi:transcriptional regulator GlxA family with amidase domain
MLNIGIYLFDNIEVLDFAGPFEVFTTASRVAEKLDPGNEVPFRVFTIGEQRVPVRSRAGLTMTPGFGFDAHPAIDLLVIPGGVIDTELNKPAVIDWIGQNAQNAQLTASICTGAFLIGEAGLLRNRRATTHWEDLEELRTFLPDTRVSADHRWIDEGSVISSAGISAGIDMSLYLVAKFAGEALAQRTARQMDYDWRSIP